MSQVFPPVKTTPPMTISPRARNQAEALVQILANRPRAPPVIRPATHHRARVRAAAQVFLTADLLARMLLPFPLRTLADLRVLHRATVQAAPRAATPLSTPLLRRPPLPADPRATHPASIRPRATHPASNRPPALIPAILPLSLPAIHRADVLLLPLLLPIKAASATTAAAAVPARRAAPSSSTNASRVPPQGTTRTSRTGSRRRLTSSSS
mmetsp:Transcript_4123/g.10708  ORF Transcript_4123/g.10708 Transcript_4123/m.10708 type:complete len:211 (+) Transcript_4123:2144-2776(+)